MFYSVAINADKKVFVHLVFWLPQKYVEILFSAIYKILVMLLTNLVMIGAGNIHHELKYIYEQYVRFSIFRGQSPLEKVE